MGAKRRYADRAEDVVTEEAPRNHRGRGGRVHRSTCGGSSRPVAPKRKTCPAWSASSLSSSLVGAGPSRKTLIVPWRAPAGPPETGDAKIRRLSLPRTAVLLASVGVSVVLTKMLSGLPVASFKRRRTASTWWARRTAMLTDVTASQKTAARSEPENAEPDSCAHSATRGVEVVAVDLAALFGEVGAEVSANRPEADHQMHDDLLCDARPISAVGASYPTSLRSASTFLTSVRAFRHFG